MLVCVTASHKTASFELLERLSRNPGPVAPMLVDAGAEGAVVLSTCNRFEAYVDIDADPETAETVVADAIARTEGVPADALEGSYRVLSGRRVAEHLFAVASGLESVVSGEGEIAGQVRRALATARTQGTTSAELERLFQRASQAQRRVKNDTALSRAGRSLVRLALDLADSRIVDWAAERVLLIGTGAYAAVTLAAVRERGAADIAVHSPSGRAAAFAAKHGIRPVPAADYAAAARRATLLITCTSVADPVLAPHHLERPSIAPVGCPVTGHTAPIRAAAGTHISAGAMHSQLVVDLGMPRNVDPAVAQVAGVTLLDLETIRLHAPLEELQATDAARRIVRAAADSFHVAGDRRSVTPAVVALRSHVFSLLEDEIERARRRGDDDGRIEQALRHLAGVLLHTPTARAHDLAEAGRADEFITALGTLYGLTPAADASAIDPTGESASA